jgi:tRNA nucleotidyltransferase/poly(A) polymerase
MESLKSHPQYKEALEICQKLRQQGHQALLAGGCVRDGLLNRVPKDIDVATSATPEQVEQLFPKTLALGKAFGVIQVQPMNEEGGAKVGIEVATFRTDGEYKDGRRPETVAFSSAEEDAKRRDFTINALFYDPVSGKVLDFVEGQMDLANKMIRAVGDAKKRFSEDQLRILRALRFQAQLQFQIEAQTQLAIEVCAPMIRSVSAERVFKELDGLLNASAPVGAIENLIRTQLLYWYLQIEVTNELPLKISKALFQLNPWFGLVRELELRGLANAVEVISQKCKFSNILTSKLKKNQWVYQQGAAMKFDIPAEKGQLLEKYFDLDIRAGVLFYKHEQGGKKEFEQLEAFYQLQAGVLPKPRKSAQDFPNKQGEALGRALKDDFWNYLIELTQKAWK